MYFLKLILLLELTICSLVCNSAYYPIGCQGDIPFPFLNNYFENAQANFEFYKKILPLGNTNTAREFYHSGQYNLRDKFLSGEVIYGDPISAALQVHANKIVSDLGLNCNPRIYLLRSTEPNAYATQTGVIFFTTGLISYMDDFQQLVYILCHEIAHVEVNHLYKKYFEVTKIQNTSPTFRKDLIDNYYIHSVKNEFEADRIGFGYFTKMRYDRTKARKSLEKLDSSYIRPFYKYNFDSTINLSNSLPGLTVTKDDVVPFMNAALNFSQSTHPEFLDRYDSLKVLMPEKYDFIIPIEDAIFDSLKKIATNETLLSYYEYQDYYSLISYYHLGDHTFCDKEFLHFLYTKSIYVLLKNRIFVESERRKYDPTKIVVEHHGPLQEYLDIIEPSDFLGPERQFIKYFKKIPLSEHWLIGAKEYIHSNYTAPYFKNNESFCKEYIDIFNSLKIDTCSNSDLYETMIKTKQELDSTWNIISAKNDSLKKGNKIYCIIDPYYKESASSSLDQSKVNMEHFDSIIYSSFTEQLQTINSPFELFSVSRFASTNDVNNYFALYSLSFERIINEQFDHFATCLPYENLNELKTLRYLSVFEGEKGLAIYSIDFEIAGRRLENEIFVRLNTTEDGDGKIKKLVEKYLSVAIEN